MDDKQLEARLIELLDKYPDMDPVEVAKMVMGDAPPPPGVQINDFFGHTLSNLVGIPKGLYNLVTSPKDTLSQSLANAGTHLGDAKQMFANGDRVRGAVHALATIPEALGLPMATAHDEMIQGNYGAGLADAGFAAGVPMLPKVAGKVATKLPGSGYVGDAAAKGAKMTMGGAEALLERINAMKAQKGPRMVETPPLRPDKWLLDSTNAAADQYHQMMKAGYYDGFNPETMPIPGEDGFIMADKVAGEYPTGLGTPRYSFVPPGFNPELPPPAVEVPTKFINPATSSVAALADSVAKAPRKAKKK